MTRRLALLLLLAAAPAGLAAQDTTRVELRLYYNNPKLRPSLVVLPAAGLDSVRAIVERDLDFSDRFELIPLPPMMAPAGPEGIQWGPYKAMNVVIAIELQPAPNGVRARLWEVGAIPAPIFPRAPGAPSRGGGGLARPRPQLRLMIDGSRRALLAARNLPNRGR